MMANLIFRAGRRSDLGTRSFDELTTRDEIQHSRPTLGHQRENTMGDRLGKFRKPLLRLLLVTGLALGSHAAGAVTFTSSGNLTRDDQVVFVPITLDGIRLLNVTSIGYAGGIDASGAAVPRGGFDT